MQCIDLEKLFIIASNAIPSPPWLAHSDGAQNFGQFLGLSGGKREALAAYWAKNPKKGFKMKKKIQNFSDTFDYFTIVLVASM